MRVLVVYESLFGNTENLARAVARGMHGRAEVQLVDADEAPTDLALFDLVVAGGPTHAFGMSRPGTRRSAVEEHGAPAAAAERDGLREWLAAVSGPPGLALALFDTKVEHPKLPGSAARKAAKHVRSLGFSLPAPPETFFVGGMSGPLSAGEVERAEQWGAGLVTDLAADRVGTPS